MTSENRRAGKVLFEGVGTSGKVEEVENGYKRVNIVQILCIHIYKWKYDTC
jgi:hypothetical protein